MYNPECPKCQSIKVTINISCCVDHRCCGIPHKISCWECDFELESYSSDTILEEWIKMGGDPSDDY